MSRQPTIVDLHVTESQNPFFSGWTALIVGMTTIVFGAGLVMRHVSMNDPMPTYIAAGTTLFALLAFLVVRILRRCSVHVCGEHLVVKTGDGTERIPLANLKPQGLRVVDLSRYCNFSAEARPWQTGIPYNKTGFYPLPNGERAILLVTNPTKVCRLRSYDDGITLLLSLRDPERLGALLQLG
jgi:hypothetical protein